MDGIQKQEDIFGSCATNKHHEKVTLTYINIKCNLVATCSQQNIPTSPVLFHNTLFLLEPFMKTVSVCLHPEQRQQLISLLIHDLTF